MIDTIIHWSTDISSAPKGEMVTTTRTVLRKEKPVDVSEMVHVPVNILVISECGLISISHWVPEKHLSSGNVRQIGHWYGFFADHKMSTVPKAWAAIPDAAEILASLSAGEAIDVLPLSEVDA